MKRLEEMEPDYFEWKEKYEETSKELMKAKQELAYIIMASEQARCLHPTALLCMSSPTCSRQGLSMPLREYADRQDVCVCVWGGVCGDVRKWRKAGMRETSRSVPAVVDQPHLLPYVPTRAGSGVPMETRTELSRRKLELEKTLTLVRAKYVEVGTAFVPTATSRQTCVRP